MLQSMGSKRVGHNLVTEQLTHCINISLFVYPFIDKWIFGSIINEVATNTHIQIFLWLHFSFTQSK